MESAVLVMLDGLCAGHGTWKCSSGCPGASAVRVERGRGSGRGGTVLNRGWLLLDSELLLDTLSLRVSSSRVCQAGSVFSFPPGKSGRGKLLLGV